jgi:hypothetical protein
MSLLIETLKKVVSSYDYMCGHCPDFAIALHRMFGYSFALITAESQDAYHVMHVFGVNKKGTGFDIEGPTNITAFYKSYQTDESRFNYKLSYHGSEEDLVKHMFGVQPNEFAIAEATRRIEKNLKKYNPEVIEIKSQKKLEDLVEKLKDTGDIWDDYTDDLGNTHIIKEHRHYFIPSSWSDVFSDLF